MPVSAKFQADFSSFSQAVDKANIQLRGFESDSLRVEKSLNRMGNSFTGTRLVQDATLMAKAIENAGGVTRLTEAELRRAGTTIAEASDKMRRMGIDVPPAFRSITNEVNKLPPAAEQAKSAMSSLAGAIGVSFSVAAVINFGRELLRMGDDVVRTADRTGLLTDEVQQLSYIAKQSGNSLDELVGAIGQMQNRLASGDKSAVGAVKALNLSFDELRKAGPYQQLQLIADAVAKIPDPAGRAQVAMDLFGRTGIAILPTLQSKFAELGDAAPKMAHNTIVALDAAGDSLERFQLQIKVWAAESYNSLGKVFDQFTSLTLRVTAIVLDMSANLLELTGKIPGATKLFPGLAQSIKEVHERATFARDAAKQLTTATTDMGQEVRKATPLFTALDGGLKSTEDAAKKAAEAYAKMAEAVNGGNTAWERMIDLQHALKATGHGVGQLENIPQGFSGLSTKPDLGLTPVLTPQKTLSPLSYMPDTRYLPTHVDTGASSFASNLFGGVPNAILAAVQGGGSKLQAAGGAIGAAIFGPGSSLTGTITKGISSLFGANGVLTKTLSSAVPIIGSLIGPAIAGIAKLFGKTEESTKVSPVRDEFFKLQGGLETLNPRVQQLTGSLQLVDNIFKAKTVDQYNAALQKLNDAFAFQDQALSTLTATAERYGFTLEELGPALQRSDLDKQAQELYKDFQILSAGGIDHVAILTRMSDSVNAYVKNALSMGVEVPEAMRPMLEDMAKQGLLTDAAGNKIDDLSTAGISFALTMSEGFKQLIEGVQKLTDAISRGLGNAITNIPQPHIVGHIDWESDSGVVGPNIDGGGFQGGTHGRLLNFGAGKRVTLHGLEQVKTANEVASDTAAQRATLAKLDEIGELLRDQPKQLVYALQVAG